TGQVASLGAGPSGMLSSSTPPGVLSELAARPNKRRRTEASAVRSAPGSGVHPARSGTSRPFPFALEHDNLPPNSHLHHPKLSRADAPEPQGTTAQQPASKHVAVHKERRAPVDRPSTSGDRRSEFAQLRDKIRSATGPSSFNALCPADQGLIEQFIKGIEKAQSNVNTARSYIYLLIRFSNWLRDEKKAGLPDRFLKNQDGLKLDVHGLKPDVLSFQNGKKTNRLNAALNHLNIMVSDKDGTVKIRDYSHHEAHGGDEKFITNALSAYPDYASTLRALSAWLHAQNKEGLCEPGRLHSKTLMHEAEAFANTRMASSEKSVSALRKLQKFYLSGETDFVKRHSPRKIPEADRQLREKYKKALWESSRGKTYYNQQSYAEKTSSRMIPFSAWLDDKAKATMASRLHDSTLDDDLALYTSEGNSQHVGSMKGMLKKMREMLPLNAQSPDLGGRAEPSGPSYPSMVAPTHSGDQPQTSHSWDLNISAAEELAGPSGSAPPEPQAPQRSWDLNMPAAEVSGASWSAFAFDRDARYPDATGSQRTTAMSQASLPTFDEDDA
ncbi:hypothetical protein, partial [Xanthomonas fragariae]